VCEKLSGPSLEKVFDGWGWEEKTTPKSVMEKRHPNRYFDFDFDLIRVDSIQFNLIRYMKSTMGRVRLHG
jgi:hypothetical protein